MNNSVINLTKDVEGDFMEFGVYVGDSFVSIINFMSSKGLFETRRLFGFDSWEGLPKEAPNVSKYLDWWEGNFKSSYEDFKANIEIIRIKQNIPEDRIIITKGWFKDTLTEQFKKDNNINKLAFVNIDVDLYISTIPILEFIRPLLQKGTIIRFDDWTNKEQGEHKAWDEFVTKYPFLYERKDNGNEQIITIL